MSNHLGHVVMLGDCRVGKSCLSRVMCNRGFKKPYKSGLVEYFFTKSFKLDGTSWTFRVFDTYGEEMFRSVSSFYYRGAHGCFLVYDVTKKTSFDNLTYWLSELDDYENAGECKDVSILLVGNKCDLVANREVDYHTAKEFADQHGIPYIETSAKDGQNVDMAVFRLAADNKRRFLDKRDNSRSDRVTLKQTDNENWGCCYN